MANILMKKRKLKDESIAHNALLKTNVEELKEKYPSIKICYYETADAFKVIMEAASNMVMIRKTLILTTAMYMFPGLKTLS